MGEQEVLRLILTSATYLADLAGVLVVKAAPVMLMGQMAKPCLTLTSNLGN